MPTDPTETTGQPATGTQPSSNGQPASTTPQVELVEKHRLDLALRKIEELTLANRALADGNATKDINMGQLTAKLTQQEADKAALVGQHTTALTELKGKFDTASTELEKATARNRKLEAIKTSGHTELVAIIDDLPTAETPEAQLVIINNMAKFAESIAKKRESELLAGSTDGATSMGTLLTPPAPATEDAWQKKINSLPLGSKERAAAFDEYFAWTSKPKQ